MSDPKGKPKQKQPAPAPQKKPKTEQKQPPQKKDPRLEHYEEGTLIERQELCD